MPAVGAAIGAIAGWLGGGSILAGLVGNLLMSTALSALSTAMQRRQAAKQRQPGIKTDYTTEGGAQPQSFLLGWYATDGHMVCPPITRGRRKKTPNAFLTYVISLGNVPGQQLDKVIINDKEVEFESYEDSLPDGGDIPVGKPSWWYAQNGLDIVDPNAGVQPMEPGRPGKGKYAGKVWIRYYDGTQTAADPYLMMIAGEGSDFATASERPWTADMVGVGTCYAIVTFRFHRETWSGLPRCRFVMSGVPLYDPRQDSSVGGNGTQRWASPSTWTPSNNALVQAYNVLRGIPIMGGPLWGYGADAADLPLAAWTPAMNKAGEEVVGGPRWRAGLEVGVDEEPADILDQILLASCTDVAEIGGVWKPRVGAPNPPVFFFSDDDILINHDTTFTPFPAIDDTYNAIHATYPNPKELWQPKDAPPRYNADWEASDDHRRRIAELTLSACPYPTQAQRVMRAYIEEERRFRRHVITLPPDADALEPLIDTVSWTSAENGYVSKLFEVCEAVSDPDTLAITVSLRERDPEDYDWQPGFELPESSAPTNTVDGSAMVPMNFEATGIALPDAEGRLRRPAARLRWGGWALEGVRQVQWEVRLTGATAALRGTVADPEAGELVIADGILPASAYEARILFLTAGALRAEWTAWYPFMTPDVRLQWSDLTTQLRDELDVSAAQIAAAAAEAAAASDAAQNALSAAQNASAHADTIVQQARDDLAVDFQAAINAAGQADTAMLAAQQARDLALGAASDADDAKNLALGAVTNAQAARDLALGAASDADDAKNLALGAASDADDAKNLALGAASDADDAKNLALGAASDAQAARDAALGHKQGAETAKQAAQNAKTAAEQAKALAEAQALAASNSAGAAAGSASTASSKATEAGQSATAAAAQVVIAKTGAARVLPAEITDDYWRHTFGGVPGNSGLNRQVIKNNGYVTVPASDTSNVYFISQAGLPWIDGRTYRITVTARAAQPGGWIKPLVKAYLPDFTTYSWQNNDGILPLAGTGDWETVSIEKTLPTLPDPAITQFRIGVFTAEAFLPDIDIDLRSILVEDVTSEKSASGSATAAVQAQQAASASETAAGQQAAAAASSATTASTKAGEASTSASQAAQSETNAAGSASAASQSATTAAGSATTAGQKATAAAGSASTASTKATEASQSAAAAASSATTASTKAGEASTSAQQAAQSKTDAAGSASSASNSATAAADSATTAGDSASAASGSASTASTKANEAAQSATAAASSATTASTKAGEASTSASQAAQSKTDADGSASSASNSATAAAGSATRAGQKATAAAGSASTASTKATEASQSAQAAASSATTASTKAGEASTSAQQAAQSKTDAAGSASSASNSATAAADSATTAGDSASAASGFASTASTKATEAAQSATAANASATIANTKAGEASTSATQSASSKDAAATSATAASNSATASQGYSVSARSNAARVLPAEITDDYWRHTFGGVPGSHGLNEQVIKKDGYVTVPASDTSNVNFISQAGLPWIGGRTYRITVTARAAQAGNWIRAMVRGLLPDFSLHSWADYSGPLYLAGTGDWETVSIERTLPALPDPAITQFRIGIYTAESILPDIDIDLRSILIEDVTSEKSAAGSAAAASGFASTAETKATEASQSATAANASAAIANTKAGEASTSASQAAQSETNAAGSASAASQSATTAAGSATTAGQKATAAAGSASTASTKATEASQSAAAAASSATTASTKAGEASTSAQQAAQSKTDAAGSASSASNSATAAADSATTAGDSASAASGFASTASTKATEAAQSATAANASATIANTKAGEASTSATQSASSKDAAATSATAASNSATASQGYSVSARSNAARVLPAEITDDYWRHTFGGVPGSHGLNEQVIKKGGYVTVPASDTSNVNFLSQAGLPWVAGRTYRITVTARAAQAGNWIRSFVKAFLPNFTSHAWYDTSGILPLAGTGDWETVSIERTLPALPDPSITQFRIGVVTAEGALPDIDIDLRSILVEDVTSEKSAAGSAAAASGFASTAETKATEASQSATAANASAAIANTKAGEASTSASQAAQSETNAAGSASAASQSATTAAGSATLAGQKATAASGSASTASTKATEASQSATAASASATTASTKAGEASTSAQQASASETNAAGSASAAASSATTAANSATTAGQKATAASTSASQASTHATNAGSSAAAANTAKLAAESARDGSVTAKGQAEIARNDAVVAKNDANTAAAGAQSSFNMSAQLISNGQGVLNDQFMAATGAWINWNIGGTGTWTPNQFYPIGRSYTMTIANGEERGLKVDNAIAAGVWKGQANAAAYVVEVELTRTGNLAGAGVRLSWSYDGGSIHTPIPLPAMLAGGSMAGTRQWARAVFVRPAGATGAFLDHMLYIFAGYSMFGTIEAKTLVIHRVNIRPATAEEMGSGQVMAAVQAHLTQNYLTATQTNQAISSAVQTVSTSLGQTNAAVTMNSTALSTLNGSVARFSLVTDVNGGKQAAGLEIVSFDGNGVGTGTAIVLNAMNIIAKGTLSADAAVFGLGKNLLIDPEWMDGLANWSGPLQFYAPGDASGYANPAYPVAYMYSGAPGGGTLFGFATPAKDDAGTKALGCPVAPGETLIGSIYANAYRCSGQVYINYYDAAGSLISTIYGESTTQSFSASVPQDGWRRIKVKSTVPTGAVLARFSIRKTDTNTGEADSYLFLWKPQLEKTNPHASEPSEWSPGGVAYINGGRLFANSVITKHLGAGAVTAEKISVASLSAISANMGTIQVGSGNIANLAVNRLKLAGNSVTVPYRMWVSTTGTGVEFSFNTPDQSSIICGFSGSVNIPKGTYASFWLTLDGDPIMVGNYHSQIPADMTNVTMLATLAKYPLAMISIPVGIAAGNHTLRLAYQDTGFGPRTTSGLIEGAFFALVAFK